MASSPAVVARVVGQSEVYGWWVYLGGLFGTAGGDVPVPWTWEAYIHGRRASSHWAGTRHTTKFRGSPHAQAALLRRQSDALRAAAKVYESEGERLLQIWSARLQDRDGDDDDDDDNDDGENGGDGNDGDQQQEQRVSSKSRENAAAVVGSTGQRSLTG
ncbi:serine/threonine-protein kinase [Pseudoscourfieldia marina]